MESNIYKKLEIQIGRFRPTELQTELCHQIINSGTLFISNIGRLKRTGRNHSRRCVILKVKISCCRSVCHSDLNLRTSQRKRNLDTFTILLCPYVQFLIVFTNEICPKGFFDFLNNILFSNSSLSDKSFLLK